MLKKDLIFLGKKTEGVLSKYKTLGFENVFFIKKIKSFVEVKEKNKNKYDGYLLDTKNTEELLKTHYKLKDKKFLFLVCGQDEDFNRKISGTTFVTHLINPERLTKKDHMHYRNSGFNHITARFCKENNIALIIDLNELKNKIKKKKELSLQLGRIKQNIKIAEKFKLNIVVTNFPKKVSEIESFYELRDFFDSIKKD